MQFSYSGTGSLDPNATLDSITAFWTIFAGPLIPTTFQLTGAFDPERHTGSLTLTYNGQNYAVVAEVPQYNAEPLLGQIVVALRQHDWAQLYIYASSQMRAQVSQADFVGWFTADLQTVGSLSGVSIVQAPTYVAKRAGYHGGGAVLELTFANGGASTIRWVQVALVVERGQWQFDNFVPVSVDQLAVAAGGPYTVAEGQSVAVAATPFNPTGDTLAYAWDLDNDGSFETSGQGVTFAAAALDGPATRTIRVRATGSGGASAVGQTTVTVTNAAPAATFAAPGSVVAGQGFTLGLNNPQDVAADRPTLQYAFDCGDGLGNGPFGSAATRACPTTAAGTRAVGSAVRDKDGGIATYTASVTVLGANTAPVVGTIVVPQAPLVVGAAGAFSAPFTDPDAQDTHTATWTWGDGTTSAGSVAPASGNGGVTGSHAYAAPGLYPVSVTVIDGRGGSGSAATQGYVVVYDAGGGFLTGGGWITAPVGACQQPAACGTASGKANLAVNAKYHNGATVPTGNAQYKVGSFEVKATAYSWLVITGGTARLQGSATVNGASGYAFLLTVTDGDAPGGDGTDRYRLRVWHQATGALVYDTQPGAPDNAAPTIPLGGGSIVIH